VGTAPPKTQGTAARAGRGGEERGRVPAGRVGVLLGVAAAVFVFYLYLYPLEAFRFPIGLGLDTPVYTWWTRYGGAVGLGAPGIGPRPGILGTLATVQSLTQLPWGALMGAIGPVLALSLGLAAGGLVEIALGPNLMRSALTSLLTAVFLSPLVPGYFATLFFGTCFVAGLALIVEGLDRAGWFPLAASVGLLGAAGLGHPVFLLFGSAVILGGAVALIPSSRRARAAGVPLLRTPAVRSGLPVLGAAAVAAGGLAAVGVGLSPGLDTSRDAFLRRLGRSPVVLLSYRNQLFLHLPAFTGFTFGAAVMAGPALEAAGDEGCRKPRDGKRFFWGVLFTWLATTLAAIALLVLRFDVPGHRMVLFCVPLPVILAVGVSSLLRSDLERSLPPHQGRKRLGRGSFLMAAHVFAVLLLVAAGWYGWYWQWESVSIREATQLTAAGRLLASQPPGTPLILVTDDPEGLLITARANLLRDAVPAERAADVFPYLGRPNDLLEARPTLTGVPEHDLVATDSWRRIRHVLDDSPVAVVLSVFDPGFYRQVAGLPRSVRPAEGVATIPGYGGRSLGDGEYPVIDSGLEPVSPWLPPVVAPLLLVLLSVVGFPWVRAIVPERDLITRLLLSPALGLTALALASVAADAFGLRLAGAGGVVAGIAALGSGIAASLLRAPPSCLSFDT
jgi:hypothetical protein